jgi:hypothetical protein
MKITAATVAALGCVQYTTAFLGPQFGNKSLRSSKIQMQGNSDDEVPKWVGPVSTAFAGLMFASQPVCATTVDHPILPMFSPIEIANGKALCFFTVFFRAQILTLPETHLIVLFCRACSN